MRTKPLRWKPKFSVVGIAGSVIGAFGFLLFFQQRGSVFPTTLVTIMTLVVSIFVGVAVPSFFRFIVFRRFNRALAQTPIPKDS
jgi:hypothetical protein